MIKVLTVGFCLLAITSVACSAQTTGKKTKLNEFVAGSITLEEGLASWQTFYEVASHPRCSNCHVGPSNRPMWSGPSYGKTRPHGMNIKADESRMGIEAVPCATCHVTLLQPSDNANAIPHTPPKVASPWSLAPVEAEWFGKSSSYICNQLKDPERNGDRTIRDVASHLDHDRVLQWAWNPGGNRQSAPHSLQIVMDSLMKWSAAGTPCPSE